MTTRSGRRRFRRVRTRRRPARRAAERDVGAARGLVAGVAGQIAGSEGELRTLPVRSASGASAAAIRERCEETEQVVSVAPRSPAGPGRCRRNWQRSTFASARPRKSLASATVSVAARRGIGCSRRKRPSPMSSAKPTPRRSVPGRAGRSARSSPASARRSSGPWKRSCQGVRTSRRPLPPSSGARGRPGSTR